MKEYLPKTKVTVVVPVRNEECKIGNCIRCVLEQNYPMQLLEILVVNDFSSDETLQVVKHFEPQIELIDLKEVLPEDFRNKANKKTAIKLAIEKAKGDLIVTTDGDCEMGKNWIRSLVYYFEFENHKLISAPVQFSKTRNLLGYFQELDLMSMVAIGAADIQNGRPTMCNGANLCYEKNAFNELGGFEGIEDVPTGDDLFILHKFHRQFPGLLAFVKSPEAIVYTHAENSISSFFWQRIRWLSKSTKFQYKVVTATLVMSYIFNLFIVLNLILAFAISRYFLYVFFAMLISKIICEMAFLGRITKFFNRPKLLYLIPVISVFHIVYVVVLGLLGNLIGYRWKGRKVSSACKKTH